MITNPLRKLDSWLRNEPFRSPEEPYTTRPFEDLFDNPDDDPVRTRVYWAIRRFWNHHWLCNPRDIYYGCVYAYQRVTRGWDDRAVWSIDYWLDEKMPAMLRKLKVDKHGTPMSMFEKEDLDEDGCNPTDEGHVRAEARWNEVLDKMIAAFEASERMKHGTYPELGPYPLYRPAGVSREAWKKIGDDHFAASQLLQKRDEQIYEEGMALFVKHYHSLWD